MASTKFYLDTRRKADATHSLRINICHHQKTAALTLGVKLAKSQWDSRSNIVVNHPEAKYWNNFIARRKIEVDTLLLKMEDDPNISLSAMTAVQIRDHIVMVTNPEAVKAKEEAKKPKEDQDTFLKWFDRFMGRKSGRTQGIYQATRNRLVAWLGEEDLSKVKYEDIKTSWLEDFSDFLAQTCKTNSIAIHLRNIRAVVNYGIDNEVTTYYAFRRFKIEYESTRKRNLDVATLRRLFSHTCDEEWQQKYLDFFKLSFMLIGINVVDLCGLEKVNAGRVDYIRAKTHRPYSIKVESEIRELMEKYRGEKMLLDFAENYGNYRHFYNNLCKGLREIKGQLDIPELTSYWARHSWATIAASLDIPHDTIAAALGHGGNTVTDIYIEFDMKKVDEANRRVLDWVLYGVDYRKAVETPKPKRGRPRKTA